MTPRFRAWVKKEERMAQVMSLHFIEGGYLTRINTYPEMGCLSIHCIDDVVLMQSTGMKDDNGVEIYEGDLLSLDGSKPYPVYWDDGAFQVGEVSDLSYVNGYCVSLLILGNIYENPELLEEVSK